MVITADKSQKRMALGKGFSSLMGLDDDDEELLEIGNEKKYPNKENKGATSAGTKITEPVEDYMERAYGFSPEKQNQSSLDLSQAIIQIKVDQIEPNPSQPRRVFDEKLLEDLSKSIKEDGVIQPVIVSAIKGKSQKYMLIAGERRWRASKLAGLEKIPAIVKEASPETTLRFALIENIQRQDLSVIEEAEAYKSLIEDFGLTQEQCAQKVGKDRSTITNLLRLLSLPKEIQEDIMEDTLSMGHGKALLSLETKQNMLRARDIIVKKQLNVRKAEQLCKKIKTSGASAFESQESAGVSSPDVSYIEETLRGYLKTRVKLIGNEKKGKIQISYFSPAELERVLSLIGGEV